MVEHRLALGAGVGVGEQALEVDGEESLRTLGQRLHHRGVQLVRQRVVARRLRRFVRVVARLQPDHAHLFPVLRQARRHVGQAQEGGVADEVEEHRRRHARLLDHPRAVAATAAHPAVLVGVVVALARDALDDAVAGDPTLLVLVGELLPNGGREAPEQVEQRRGVAAHEGAGQGEDAPAGLGQSAGGQPLGRAARLVLVLLVDHQQVEEAGHVAGDVVGQGEAARPRAVGLPEGAVALPAAPLLALQILPLQWHPLVVERRGEAGRTAEATQRLAVFVAQEATVDDRESFDDSRRPAIRQLRLLARHADEERLAVQEGQPLQIRNRPDDGGARAGHGGEHLPLPLAHQVGRAEDEHPPEARQVSGGRGDGRLAGAHLADQVRALMASEGEGHGADSVALGAQGPTLQSAQVEAPLMPVLRRVDRRVGAEHRPRDCLLEVSMKRARFTPPAPLRPQRPAEPFCWTTSNRPVRRSRATTDVRSTSRSISTSGSPDSTGTDSL